MNKKVFMVKCNGMPLSYILWTKFPVWNEDDIYYYHGRQCPFAHNL